MSASYLGASRPIRSARPSTCAALTVQAASASSGERWSCVQASVLQTIFLLLVFLPFSYVMDSFLYRTYQRRAGQTPKN